MELLRCDNEKCGETVIKDQSTLNGWFSVNRVITIHAYDSRELNAVVCSPQCVVQLMIDKFDVMACTGHPEPNLSVPDNRPRRPND